MNYLFSPWRMKYIINHAKETGCIFCNALAAHADKERLIVYRGQHAFVLLNKFPYTSGHLMVAPQQHCADLEVLPPEARAEMMELSARAMTLLRGIYQPQAFNFGANIGQAAGAGVPGHVHLHIVPRWNGDTNFMSSLAETRVLPESLAETWARVREAFDKAE